MSTIGVLGPDGHSVTDEKMEKQFNPYYKKPAPPFHDPCCRNKKYSGSPLSGVTQTTPTERSVMDRKFQQEFGPHSKERFAYRTKYDLTQQQEFNQTYNNSKWVQEGFSSNASHDPYNYLTYTSVNPWNNV